jgi:hypothetical protein
MLGVDQLVIIGTAPPTLPDGRRAAPVARCLGRAGCARGRRRREREARRGAGLRCVCLHQPFDGRAIHPWRVRRRCHGGADSSPGWATPPPLPRGRSAKRLGVAVEASGPDAQPRRPDYHVQPAAVPVLQVRLQPSAAGDLPRPLSGDRIPRYAIEIRQPVSTHLCAVPRSENDTATTKHDLMPQLSGLLNSLLPLGR